MSNDVSFGRWLSARRHLLDLTQDELARQAGCAVVTIRKLEADERRPSKQLAERLAACLALPIGERASFVRLARADPLATDAPHLGLRAEPPIVLPTPLTALIGRDVELASVRARLANERVRLLTLLGPPGVGKTRLAIGVAAAMEAHVSGGVVFVDLAPISLPELVLPAIATVLGVPEQGDQPIALLLRAALRTRRLLLILDNFEQVVDAAPALAELLAACPAVTTLVTSRVALRVRGEHLHPVPPLPVPDLAVLPTANALAAIPSVALFVEHARAMAPEFALTDANAAAVATICEQLDGLPLAIELLAARVGVLPPAAMLARLSSRLDLLSDGARDLPPPHRTLRGAIAWSYELLTANEQAFFRRLSIFVGGCMLEAAEAVCVLPNALSQRLEDAGALEGAAPAGADVLALVTALVRKSLLRQKLSADGSVRFTMLATIREFAHEQLVAAGEHTLIAQRHADYYRQLAALGEEGIRSREQLGWLDQLSREHDNLRATLGLYHGQNDGAPQELELVASLWTFFVLRCHYAEGRAVIDRALARRTADAPASRASALALVGKGFLAHFQGDVAQTLAMGEASAATWRQLEDAWGLALALNILGGYEDRGEEQRGAAALEESLALARVVGEPWCLGLALNNLAVTRVVARDTERARALLEELLALGERTQIPYLIASALWNLGRWEWAQGDYDAAQGRLADGLVIFHQLGDRVQSARMVCSLADIAWEQGEHGRAAEHYTTILTVAEELGDGLMSVYSCCRLGYVSLVEGALNEAASHFRASLALPAAQQFPRVAALCLLGVAALAQERGAWERSAYLLGAAAAICDRLGEELGSTDQRLRDQLTNAARAQRAGPAFASSWSAGQDASVEEAIRVALESV